MNASLFDDMTPDPLCAHGRPGGRGCPHCMHAARIAAGGLHPSDLDERSAPVRHDATFEERAAGATIAQATGSRYRRLVLDAHYRHPDGLTDDDVARIVDHPDMPPPRAASRRGELARMGWLERVVDDDGNRVTRPTRTGHAAQVWRLTNDARRMIYTGEVVL